MAIRQIDAPHLKESALRKRLTKINKARAGAKSHPNGLTRLTLEDLDGEERIIRDELTRRAP